MELSDEIILKIDDLMEDFCIPALSIGLAAHKGEEIPKKYANDDILVEYYNGLKEGRDFPNLRKTCELKYVRRGLKQLQITE